MPNDATQTWATQPWNPLAVRREGQAFVGGKLRTFWRRPPGIIIHHTGPGPQRVANKLETTLDEGALRIYQHVMDYCPHYVIGDRIYQLVPENYKAWHTGAPQDTERLRERFPWWADRWPEAQTGWDVLPGGRRAGAARPNDCIGVELITQPGNKRFTETQYRLLDRLLDDLCSRLGIPRGASGIVGHADIDPVSRGTKKGPWDPPAHTDWPFIWGRKAVISGGEDEKKKIWPLALVAGGALLAVLTAVAIAKKGNR